MPFVRVERIERTIAQPAGGGATEFARIQPGNRIVSCTCRVRQASDGTGTVSIGRSGAVTSLMATADVGAGVLGVKQGATGADLAGNGYEATTEQALVTNYTVGTNTVHPIVTVTVAVVHERAFDQQMSAQ